MLHFDFFEFSNIGILGIWILRQGSARVCFGLWVAMCAASPSRGQPTVASSRGQDPLLLRYRSGKGGKSIGCGSFGKVFIGTRLADNRNYALKYVDVADEEWQLEYELMNVIRHPNVAKAVDMFEPHARRPHTGIIVTELYDMDLSSYLRRRSGRVTQKVARDISRQLGRGLAAVHELGIIHRDIKPQNVLLKFEADWGALKAALTDFGLARWLPRTAGDVDPALYDTLVSSQGHGAVMTRNVMTLWYRAPEILLADKTSPEVMYTTRIDVWSLGCVMYELLRGQALARAADEEGVLRKIIRAIGPCPPPLKAHYGERLLQAEGDAAASSQAHWSAIAVKGDAAEEAVACVNKTLQWQPSDRPSSEDLLQEAWMQLPWGGQDSLEAALHSPQKAKDSAHSPQKAKDSAEATTAAPSQDKALLVGSSVTAAPSQGQASLWRFGASVTCMTWKSLERCACSGHCYVPGHRYQGGCDAVDLLVGSSYCPSCACSVYACVRPRLHGPFCSVHKKLWEKGPLEFVLTRCAHKALPWLMPCDVTDFVQLYPSVRHDLAFVVIIALLKEPRANAIFVKKALALPPGYGVDDLAAVLMDMLDDIRSPTETHRKEIEALNQQGVGRFTGVASTCRAWGLIECVPGQEQKEGEEKEETTNLRNARLEHVRARRRPCSVAGPKQGQASPSKANESRPRKRIKTKQQAEAGACEGQASTLLRRRVKGEPSSPLPRRGAQGDAHWELGLSPRAYRRTGHHECLADMLQATRDFRQPPEIVNATTFKDMVVWAEEFDEFLGRKSTTWAGQSGYVRHFMRRKLVLGQLSSGSCGDLSWSEVPIDMLKRMSPDQHDFLSCVPSKWSVADLSRYCTERDDWGVFVSMYACLWAAVTKVKPYQGHRDALMALAASDQFRDAAKLHIEHHGAAAHVLMLVKEFGPVGTWPKALGGVPGL